MTVVLSDRAQQAAAPAARDVVARYIRPLAARDIRGLTWVGDRLLVLDAPSGRLSLVDPETDDTRVVNDGLARHFRGAGGSAISQGWLWFTTDEGLHRSAWGQPRQARPGVGGMARAGAEPAVPAPAGPAELGIPPGGNPPDGEQFRLGRPALAVPLEGAQSVAAWADRIYVAFRGRLEERDATTLELRAQAPLLGIGRKAISATDDALWLVDDLEQTLYCLDRETLALRFMAVTPLEGPTAVAAAAGTEGDAVHVAYYEDEPYLKDNPWITPSWEVRYRDRALVHRIEVRHDAQARCAWSTGHRIRMHYYVELDPESDVPTLTDVQWRMSLPIDSARQRLVSVEPIGLPFHVEEELGQPVAVFDIPRVDRSSRQVLGWRATLEVFGVKHLLTAADLEGAPPLAADLQRRYLVDDEDLDLGSPEVARATRRAVGDESNVLERARRIRSYVYDRLSYEMGHADSPIDVLARGTGSCGEHVGVIMALLRSAGVACRVAGRYKCPYQPWSTAPLYPDFNHVWVDLYLPGQGWFPVESNPDGDVVDVGPYPDRFFLGLPWRHVEVGKDISFEKVTYDAGRRRRRIGARRLSANHIRFDVLAEIAPVPEQP